MKRFQFPVNHSILRLHTQKPGRNFLPFPAETFHHGGILRIRKRQVLHMRSRFAVRLPARFA